MRAIWQNNTPYSKLLITVGIILLTAVLFTMLSTGLAIAMYHLNMEQIQHILSDYTDPEALPILKLIQTISAFGTFVVPPFFLAYLFSNQSGEYLGLTRSPGKNWLLAIIAMLAITPLINFLGEVNSHMHLPEFLRGVETWMKQTEEQASEITKLFLKMDSPSELLLNLFMIALIPAIGEELVFRGVVQRIFSEWWRNKHIAIWVTAILFSAMHMQFYGFLPRMVLGALLGYLYYWSGSLWLPIIAHFINNAAAVIFTYLYQHGQVSVDPDAIGTQSDIVSVLISVVITSALLFYITRRSTPLPDTVPEQL
jgi:uncharacterized protein